ncbi:winged helix DNA-binding domain-containing protein, partial [Sistotremastrum niveocremeum HHB9708]
MGLHLLSDSAPGEKPNYPYPVIVKCAILGSPRQRLTLSEIYTAIENRFPYFRQAGKAWRNSVRHNLSLNKNFIKVERPITEPGKGSYWMVNSE